MNKLTSISCFGDVGHIMSMQSFGLSLATVGLIPVAYECQNILLLAKKKELSFMDGTCTTNFGGNF